jgi:hypothetical protein
MAAEMTIIPFHRATSKPRWRRIAYYVCRVCSADADYIAPRGLFTLCSQCKTKYANVFGEGSLETYL